MNKRFLLVARRTVPAVILHLVLATVPANSSTQADGTPGGTGARQAQAFPAGEVVVALREEFFNALLNAMLAQEKPLTFPLGGGRRAPGGGPESSCANEITLLREIAGLRTAVVFRDGKIGAPVAFRGSYEAPLLGCLKFEGSAATAFDLSFDETRQALTGRVTVQSVNIANMPAALNSSVTGLVQTAIDGRLNPIEILRADQLGARLPITPGTELRLRAKEIKHEVVQKELRLRIFYEVVRNV